MRALAKRRALSRGAIPTQQDPRGPVGIAGRGANIYNASSNAAVSGPQGPGFGRPPLGKGEPQYSIQPVGGGVNPQPVPNRFDRIPGGGPQTQAPNTPFALPYDPAFAEKMREIAARRAGLESGYGIAQQRIGEDFRGSESDLAEIRENTLKNLQNQFASQGILNSGINIGEQANVGREYQSELADLVQGRTRTFEDLTREFTGSQQGLQSEQEQAIYSRIRDAIPGLLERALGEAQGSVNQQFLQQMGISPVTFDPTGKVRGGPGRMPPPAVTNRSVGSPASRQPPPKKKAAIRPTKGAVKRRVTRSK
jgi:hypothetical protein